MSGQTVIRDGGWFSLASRVLAVAGALVVGWVWDDAPLGVQLGWGLQYGIFVAVSVVSSFWLWILLLNGSLAALWVVTTHWSRAVDDDPPAEGMPWTFTDSVSWANRQVEHLEALAVWSSLALVLSSHVAVQLPALAMVLFVGPWLIDTMARFRGEADTRSDPAALLIDRRALIYLATIAGLLILGLQAPDQLVRFLPVFLTLLPGLALRYYRFRRGRGRGRVERLRRARRQLNAAPWFTPGVVFVTFGALVVLSLWHRERLASEARLDLDGPPPPKGAVFAEPGGPVAPTLAVFLLADTQLRELGGRHFPGQMEVASALVPVARRPIELDMLSTATVVAYARVYAAYSAERRAANQSVPLLAHLGDFADLGCRSEMHRMVDLLKAGLESGGSPRRLAGVALAGC